MGSIIVVCFQGFLRMRIQLKYFSFCTGYIFQGVDIFSRLQVNFI